MKLVFVVFLLISFFTIHGQNRTIDFAMLRQQDNIKIDTIRSAYDHFKSIALGQKTNLILGGSHRVQLEGFKNEEFDGNLDQNDLWVLNRSMLHAHLKGGNQWEIFAELNSSQINSKSNISPVDKDQLAFNQLFVGYRIDDRWKVSFGRKNMRLGSGRLIDIREGPNVRLSFDMIDFKYQSKTSKITAFYGSPVIVQAGVFDNMIYNDEEYLGGIYWTQKWTKKTNTDTYLIYKNEDNKRWNSGVADDQRLSVGIRHFGNWNGIGYNNEFVFQTGTFGTERITAWTASVNLYKKMDLNIDNEIQIGLKTELISGDAAANDEVLNTFDGLYPRGAYFGRVARFGPSNLMDIHPYLEWKYQDLYLELDYVAFWRFSTEDGVYGPPLNLNYPGINDERFVAQQIGTIFGYTYGKHTALELETNVIFPEAFLTKSGLGDLLYHMVATVEFKF